MKKIELLQDCVVGRRDLAYDREDREVNSHLASVKMVSIPRLWEWDAGLSGPRWVFEPGTPPTVEELEAACRPAPAGARIGFDATDYTRVIVPSSHVRSIAYECRTLERRCGSWQKTPDGHARLEWRDGENVWWEYDDRSDPSLGGSRLPEQWGRPLEGVPPVILLRRTYALRHYLCDAVLDTSRFRSAE